MAAEWKGFSLGVKPFVDPIAGALASGLGSLVALIEVAVAVLDALASLMVVSGNPLSAIFRALLAEIQALIDNLQHSGVYGLFVIPREWGEIPEYKGGYLGFERTFINSFYDLSDPERPQIPASGDMGGIIFVLSAPNPAEFLRKIDKLLKFIKMPVDLKYPAPVGVRMRVSNSFGVPIEDAFWAWDKDAIANSLRLEWQEPRASRDVLVDIFAHSKFYIEKSKTRQGLLGVRRVQEHGKKTPLDKMAEDKNPLYEVARYPDKGGSPITYWEPALPAGQEFVEMGDLLDFSQNRLNFITGSYTYVFQNVKKGTEHGYYYRVRCVPSQTKLVKRRATVIAGPAGEVQEGVEVYELQLDGKPSAHLSPPSAIVYGVIPDVDPDFDLPTALLNTYRIAYLLRMDTSVDHPRTGVPALGSGLLKDDPLHGSLFTQSNVKSVYETIWNKDGSEVHFVSVPLKEGLDEARTYADAKHNLGKSLAADPLSFDPFGGADEFLLPRADLSAAQALIRAIDRKVDNKIKMLLPKMLGSDSLREGFQGAYRQYEAEILRVMGDTGVTTADLVGDTPLRQHVFELLQITGNPVAGTPPNWESIKVFEDLLPAVHDVLGQLYGSIAALDRMMADTLAELRASVEAAKDRLYTLTAMLSKIEMLIAILDELAKLDINMSMLWIPPAGGGTPAFIKAFQAAGRKPDIPYNHFTGGMALCFGGEMGSSTIALKNLFQFTFGV